MEDLVSNEQASESHSAREVSGFNYALELDLLQRKCRLMKREIQLLRRENEIMRGSPSAVSKQSTRVNTNVKTIGTLLNDFSGVEQSFIKWKRQVQLLRSTYELDDKVTKIIIVSHLKRKAQIWFYSRPENLSYDCDELLQKLKDN